MVHLENRPTQCCKVSCKDDFECDKPLRALPANSLADKGSTNKPHCEACLTTTWFRGLCSNECCMSRAH